MAKKIKVTFDANVLVGQKTGVGELTGELISSLAMINNDVDFIGYYSSFLGTKKPALQSFQNIRYKKTILIHPKLISLLRKINITLPVELFSKSKAELNIFTNFVSQPSLYKTRGVVIVYDLCFADYPKYVSDKNGKYLRKWVPYSIKNTEIVITISEFTKKRIVDFYDLDSEKIIVIPVPPKKISVNDSSILKRLNLSEYLLFVGTLEPRKNIVNLLNAYKLLPKDLQNKYPLVLVGGKGWKDETILTKIEDLKKQGNKIIQTGYVNDSEKSALYEQATLVVQPSHYEGFGMPILEAMSYGKPVVCSDIEVFHEIAKDAVLYADKDNPQNLAHTISKVLCDTSLQKKLSKKSLEYVKSYPDWQDVAKSLSRLI